MAVDVFSVPVFLVVFRETIETAIIVSILFAFLKQTLGQSDADKKVYKKLARQIWLGTAIGFLICVIVAAAIIATFYTAGRDAWGKNEDIYEGVFCLIASIIITIMGVALLRIGRLREKWRVKLTQAMENPVKVKFGKTWLKQFLEKHALFLLPFITILREGIEAVVFVAGVSFSAPASAIPLPAVVGLLAGSAVGYMLYKGGSSTKIQLFLVASTCLLYIVAAGLFSRAVWSFEAQQWNTIVGGDAAELGSGPGSYDITKSVWHVDCCSPNLNGGGGWGILQAIFGWTNSATYGSVISYNVYWIFVIIMFIVLRFHEKNGHYPFFKAKSGHRHQDSAVRVVSGGQSPSDDSIAGDKRLETTVGNI